MSALTEVQVMERDVAGSSHSHPDQPEALLDPEVNIVMGKVYGARISVPEVIVKVLGERLSVAYKKDVMKRVRELIRKNKMPYRPCLMIRSKSSIGPAYVLPIASFGGKSIRNADTFPDVSKEDLYRSWIPIAPIHKGDEDPRLHKPINFMSGQQLENKCYVFLSEWPIPFFDLNKHKWDSNCVVKDEDFDRVKKLVLDDIAADFGYVVSSVTNAGGGGEGGSGAGEGGGSGEGGIGRGGGSGASRRDGSGASRRDGSGASRGDGRAASGGNGSGGSGVGLGPISARRYARGIDNEVQEMDANVEGESNEIGSQDGGEDSDSDWGEDSDSDWGEGPDNTPVLDMIYEFTEDLNNLDWSWDGRWPWLVKVPGSLAEMERDLRKDLQLGSVKRPENEEATRSPMEAIAVNDRSSTEPGSPSTSQPKHKIFLSHSGAQKYFVENLCKGLEDHHPFPIFDIHPGSLPKGERSEHIFEVAQQCSLAVVLLSKEYFCSSKWPMLELVEFVRAQKSGRNPNLKILPVFMGLSEGEFSDQTKEGWYRKWAEWAEEDPSRIDVAEWKEVVKEVKPSKDMQFHQDLRKLDSYKENEEDPSRIDVAEWTEVVTKVVKEVHKTLLLL